MNSPACLSAFTRDIAIANLWGLGWGLYLTRQIIEAHGGTVWGKNRFSKGDATERSQRGASFGFRLPLHQRSEQLSSHSELD
jgi:two-component system NarL family sensor kinase